MISGKSGQISGIQPAPDIRYSASTGYPTFRLVGYPACRICGQTGYPVHSRISCLTEYPARNPACIWPDVWQKKIRCILYYSTTFLHYNILNGATHNDMATFLFLTTGTGYTTKHTFIRCTVIFFPLRGPWSKSLKNQ
jgi:hypothetical protein